MFRVIASLLLFTSSAHALDCRDLKLRKEQLVRAHNVDIRAIDVNFNINYMSLEAAGMMRDVANDAFNNHMFDLKEMEEVLGCH